MNTLAKTLARLPIWLHFMLVLGAGALALLALWCVDHFYQLSHHPVSHHVGQLTFSAQKLQDFFAEMSELGGLEHYKMSQRLDYLFMLAAAPFGIFLGALCARVNPPGSDGWRFGITGAWAIVFGACADALENASTFVMLANPETFAPWLAPVHSSFALLKFAGLGLGAFMCARALLFGWCRRKRRAPAATSQHQKPH